MKTYLILLFPDEDRVNLNSFKMESAIGDVVDTLIASYQRLNHINKITRESYMNKKE